MPGKSPFEPSSSVDNPPFGLDDYTSWRKSPERTEALKTLNQWGETGYPLEGGQKQARLRRVAILKSDKETDHLFTVKVMGIDPKVTKPERLYDEFLRFGSIGDVYIPTSCFQEVPFSHDFAYVRFHDKAAADAMYEELRDTGVVIDRRKVTVCLPEIPPPGFGKVASFRTMTAGAYEPEQVSQKFEQYITLDQCMSRNGAPWTSKSDLRRLEPHAPKEYNDLFGIRIDNLHRSVDKDGLREVFGKFGTIAYIYCPKPLQIVLWDANEPHKGSAIIRFVDRKCAFDALEAMDFAEIEGMKIRCSIVNPMCWPSDKTRRYM